jgi:hypothetical protein
MFLGILGDAVAGSRYILAQVQRWTAPCKLNHTEWIYLALWHQMTGISRCICLARIPGRQDSATPVYFFIKH